MIKGNRREKTVIPFLAVALIWAFAALGICHWFFKDTAAFRINLIWFFGLWVLCLADLLALGKTVQGVLTLSSGQTENRAAQVIHAFSWGVIKLACLGIFALVLVEGKTAPGIGLLMGTGTLVVVPLFGGLVWSQTVLGVL